MRELLKNWLFFIYRRFKLLWIVLTIFSFLIFSYINWYNNAIQSSILASKVANRLTNDIDKFINSIFSDINKLLLDQKQHPADKETITSSLQHININHPRVSGIAIWDPIHQIVYSTLPHNKSFLLNINPDHIFIGPITSAWFVHPIYIVQRRIGHFQAEVIIMSSILENILNSPEYSNYSIVLHDENRKKNILTLRKTEKHPWVDNGLLKVKSLLFPQLLVTTRLNSISGITVTVVENRQTIVSNFWYKEILLALDILVLAILLYFVLKKILNKYYSLHGAIKKAIKKEQFYPVYQPLFDAKNNIYSGAEVLLRWQYYHDTIIMPDLFIEEAEDTGLIIPITLQIVETAFKETKELLHGCSSFHLAFNLCAYHFTDTLFFAQFYKLVDQYSISPKQILLEITERYLLDVNDKSFIKRMLELREAGYSLAIDDYGTGHSSITYLQYYPFNFLKIDKIFIQAIGTKAITETLNDAIIQLAKKINLTIIAEGVETKEQVNYLLENEVHFLQGWHFSKALSIDQLANLLKGEKK
ncbi:EAL domain-containing protein [Legionella cincinnatiensis]|uniref:Regulatory protein (EAL domain) n=1 Tax=Legionella cincinnatiensis TaxID=28085 RepID=A0A378IKK8_9GAMM|nr:EAL domain-containing protein [Legionella cincinnatiensis]KTC78617.1 regulatory protein (EAL domain) [Legionella cincinnatiensis]STX35205.1 regulatory protein (EAL domain) [Legionella cincinnatiensis]